MAKTAFVTGGNGGIGSAIVRALCKDGFNVIVHGLKISDTDNKWFLDLENEFKVKVFGVSCDLRDQKAIENMFSYIEQKVDYLDVLINNAGFETYEACEDIALETWNDLLQVNLTSHFQCTQHFVNMQKAKAKGKGGVIVNITSIHDSVPRKGIAPYCCAKAAMHMFTKVCALEFAEYNIRVVSVGPGAIETDMNRDCIESFGRDKFNKWIPLNRVGNTQDISDFISFVVSDKASYMTGIDIHIDGGYMINTVRYDDRPNHDEVF